VSRSIAFRPCIASGLFLLVTGCSAAYFGNPIAGMKLCGCAPASDWWRGGRRFPTVVILDDRSLSGCQRRTMSFDWHEELADYGASDILDRHTVEDLEAGRHDEEPSLVQRALMLAKAIRLEDVAMMLTETCERAPHFWLSGSASVHHRKWSWDEDWSCDGDSYCPRAYAGRRPSHTSSSVPGWSVSGYSESPTSEA
jgi:hypothetical protein